MTYKSITAKFGSAMGANTGVLDTIYTCPASTQFIMKELRSLSQHGSGAIFTPYILPSGGTDLGADADQASLDVQQGATAVQIMADIGTGGYNEFLPKFLVLNAGDKIKVKRRNTFGSASDMYYSMMISGDEIASSPFKSVYARVGSTLGPNTGVLDSVYTIPGSKTFNLKQIHVTFYTTGGDMSPYILP